MATQISKINFNTYQVSHNTNSIGTISAYRNEFHDKNIYLKFKLKAYPTKFPFEEIKRLENKSLQVMIDSNKQDLIDFLIENNFILKRCCFTPTVTNEDLIYPLEKSVKIHFFDINSPNYQRCCLFLYKYYKKMHQNISPLTASKEKFIKDVPTKTGYYSLNSKKQIENLIFTETNEIAYICSTNSQTCKKFIQTVLTVLFSKYSKIFFEADDTDWAATTLLDQFNIDKKDSFNTYLFT